MKFRSLTLMIAFMLLVPVAISRGEAPLTCGEPTDAAPAELYYPIDDNPDGVAYEYNHQIIAYLNTTGSAEGLEAAIATGGTMDGYFVSGQVLEADITGDSQPEVLVNIRLTWGMGAGFDTSLTVFTCTDDGYIDLSTVTVFGFNGVDDGKPSSIVLLVDTDNDGLREIFILDRVMFQKYEERLRVYEWNGTKLVERFELGPDYMGYSSVNLSNRDDNMMTLELVIGNSYGYGYAVSESYSGLWHYRPIEQIFFWRGSRMDLLCQYFVDAPKTLYETLHSAEAYRNCGDDERALNSYRRLWDDEALQTWDQDGMLFPTEIRPEDEAAFLEQERAYLRAFAGYRLTQFLLEPDEREQAQAILKDLRETYPPGAPGYLYTAMALDFWVAYQNDRSIENACAAAEATLNRVRASGDAPGMAHYEETYNGETRRYGFYYYGGITFSADPDNLFDVPPDVGDIVKIPVCLR